MNVFADEAALDDLSRVSRSEKGPETFCSRAGGGAAGSADSKNEKSASAQASILVCTGGVADWGGVTGRVALMAGTVTSEVFSSRATEFRCDVCHEDDFTATSSSRDSADAGSGGFSRSDSVVGGTSNFLVLLTERFADFKMPGPIGPCSTPRGTKLFALKNADVGEIVLFRRTIGEACIASGDSSWTLIDFMECGVMFAVGRVLLRESTRDGGSVKVGVDTVGLDTISPHSSSSSTAPFNKSIVGVV